MILTCVAGMKTQKTVLSGRCKLLDFLRNVLGKLHATIRSEFQEVNFLMAKDEAPDTIISKHIVMVLDWSDEVNRLSKA